MSSAVNRREHFQAVMRRSSGSAWSSRLSPTVVSLSYSPSGGADGCSSSAACGSSPLTALLCQRRAVVQSNTNGHLSLPSKYQEYQLAQKLKRNKGGAYYRLRHQKLWPSTEALEANLSSFLYSPIERTAVPLLPRPQRQQQDEVNCIAEGHGAEKVLAALTDGFVEDIAEQLPPPLSDTSLSFGEYEDDMTGHPLIALQQHSPRRNNNNTGIGSKLLTEEDVEGSVLASAGLLAPLTVENDRGDVAAADPVEKSYQQRLDALRDDLTNNQQSAVSWKNMRHLLDPIVCQRATEVFGNTATKLQVRLLTALLDPDHNDVVLNGVTGAGKTSALMLALLQAIRNEDAGLNVLVASNAMNAKRMADQVSQFVGEDGGAFVDCGAADDSWLMLAPFREGVERYVEKLCRSKSGRDSRSNGSVRLLITTADVFCEMLFEHKLEFEALGYLRRVYVDDCGAQLAMLPPNAPRSLVRNRLRDPVAIELLLGTLHQMPSPHIRSIMQLGCVSADLDSQASDHLKALCLKPERHTIVLSIPQLPSRVHCVHSFHLLHDNVYTYTVELLRNAAATIPGRVVIFIRKEDEILTVRQTLRRLGMDARMLSEVQKNGEDAVPWKFVLMREHEAPGVDLPRVSHVVITFPPASRQSLLHMAGRAGRLGNVGWIYIVSDRRCAKHCRTVVEQLGVNDFCSTVVTKELEKVPEDDVHRWTKDPELYGMDPQFAVQQHYDQIAENPAFAGVKREIFTKPHDRNFYLEDYTPIPELHRRQKDAKALAFDMDRDPKVAVRLQQQGLVDRNFKPTGQLRRLMKDRSQSKTTRR